jgi:hypothetical protein
MIHEAEYGALVTKKRIEIDVSSSSTDYQRLLIQGQVTARPDDVGEWRKTIKASARADKISVATGVSDQDAHLAWAFVNKGEPSDAQRDTWHWKQQAIWAAEALVGANTFFNSMNTDSGTGHENFTWIAFDDEKKQAAGVCIDCHARLFMDWSDVVPSENGPTAPFMEGEAIDETCTIASR